MFRLFFFFNSDDGNIFIGLRGVYQARHGAPGMGGRFRNLASLFGIVRVDVRVDRRGNRSVSVVFRRLPGNQTTADGREYRRLYLFALTDPKIGIVRGFNPVPLAQIYRSFNDNFNENAKLIRETIAFVVYHSCAVGRLRRTINTAKMSSLRVYRIGSTSRRSVSGFIYRKTGEKKKKKYVFR